jgi:hypothetical protein
MWNIILTKIQENWSFIMYSFGSVVIIQYVVKPVLEMLLKKKSLTRALIWIENLQQYVYFVIPILFALLLSFLHPINDSFILNIFSYYAAILLIFNALFKTILINIIDKLKGM